MSIWIGWFVGPKLVRDEVDLEGHKMSGSLYGFFNFCIKFIVPVAMAFYPLWHGGRFHDNSQTLTKNFGARSLIAARPVCLQK